MTGQDTVSTRTKIVRELDRSNWEWKGGEVVLEVATSTAFIIEFTPPAAGEVVASSSGWKSLYCRVVEINWLKRNDIPYVKLRQRPREAASGGSGAQAAASGGSARSVWLTMGCSYADGYAAA